LAATNGNSAAKHLLREMEIFLSPQELAQARANIQKQLKP
jgi:hypothetical protein